MDANGDNVSNLTEDTGSVLTGGYEPPQWSPDGTSLLFTSNRSGDLEIWKASFPGGALINLTQSPSSTDDTPRWSADGESIFFTRIDGAGTELFSMNNDGSGQTLIEIAGGSEFLYPRLSPDATKLAWASSQDGNYEIYTAGLVERSALRLTNEPTNDEQPQWRSCP
jgi:TolB protein